MGCGVAVGCAVAVADGGGVGVLVVVGDTASVDVLVGVVLAVVPASGSTSGEFAAVRRDHDHALPAPPLNSSSSTPATIAQRCQAGFDVVACVFGTVWALSARVAGVLPACAISTLALLDLSPILPVIGAAFRVCPTVAASKGVSAIV